MLGVGTMPLSQTILDAYRHSVGSLEAMGFSVTEESPTDSFLAELRDAGKNGVSPALSWSQSDLSAETNFWLALRKDGDLIGTVSGRIDRVSEGDFPGFVERSLRRQWCTNDGANVKVTLPNRYLSLRGQVVYMGDFFFRKDFTGSQEQTFCFSNAANAFAFARWPEADLLYAHLRLADAIQKAPLFGFTSEMLFNVSVWENPPHYRSFDECFCTLERSNFEFNMRAFNSDRDLFTQLPKRQSREATGPKG